MVTRDLTKKNATKNIFFFSVPMILAGIFTQLYTLVNSVFVGNLLGLDALAGIGACYPVVFFITSLILGISTGASVVVSHYYGAEMYDKIHDIISTFYIFFASLGIVICGLSIVFANEIFSIFSMTQSVKEMAIVYFRIYMLGMFFSTMFHSLTAILRGMGDSTTQLWFLIPANIFNAFLSYLFLGIMHLGIASSAWASVISQFIAFVSMFCYLGKTHLYLKFDFHGIRFVWDYLKMLVRVSLPSGLQQSVVSLAQILILSLVVKFGTDAMAAYSSAMRIESIALLFVLNISNALTAFVGTNYGAKMYDRVKSGLVSGIFLMVILSIVVLVVFCLLKNPLMAMFTDNKNVINIGAEYLLVDGLGWILFSVMMMYTAFFRGIGRTFSTMIITIIYLLIVRFPVAYLLMQDYGTTGIWLSAPISWLLGVIAYVIYYKFSNWRKTNIIKLISILLIFFAFFSANSTSAKNCGNKVTLHENKVALYSDKVTEYFYKVPQYFYETACFSADVKNSHYSILNIEKDTTKYPQNEFSSPLNIPLTLTGTFAEIRGAHFHSGIDIRTNEKVGYAVLAPMDGWVSRIKVQAFGGGKNLYIKHNNGYTTVYMHLLSYEGEIGQFVKDYQYKHKTYTFDYVFKEKKIFVHKGDTIALSGESGVVQGPHLHFEIRNSLTEQPINPLLFGLNVEDTIPPYLASLAITSLDGYEFDTLGNNTLIINPQKDTLFPLDTLHIYGRIYFSILAYDPSQGSSMRNGNYRTEIYVNDDMLFSHAIDSFSFNDYGYVDAVINYPLYIKSGDRYLSSRLYKGGKLPFDTYKTNGILKLDEDSVYKIRIVLTDLDGNRSDYEFFIKGDSVNEELKTKEEEITKDGKYANFVDISYNVDKTIECLDGSMYYFPENSLYENILFSHYSTKGKYSNIHHIHTEYEPLKKNITLRLKPYKIVSRYKNKYLVVKLGANGRKSSMGGKINKGYIEAKVGNFGVYTVDIDTIAPNIKTVNFRSNKRIKSSQNTLKIRISDNISGIKSYNAYLNGEWVLMEYDGKCALLTYTIDERLLKGRNSLKIELIDRCGNKREKTFYIIY